LYLPGINGEFGLRVALVFDLLATLADRWYPDNPPNEGVERCHRQCYLVTVENPLRLGACVKILLVDDHALFRAGLRMLLATIGRQVTCLETDSVAAALALIAAHPDTELCLLDLMLKNESGFGAIQIIKDAAPQVAVVVVSGAEDSSSIRNCIDAGAMSFIPKSVTPEVLTQALQYVLSGAVYLPEQVVTALDQLPQRPQLTQRQQQVLQALSRGLPTKSIARELGLSEHTVKDYIASVFQVLGAHNRTEAVIKASQLRLHDYSTTVPR
jgi:DNA-binding NarL/FixJ family response regulator